MLIMARFIKFVAFYTTGYLFSLLIITPVIKFCLSFFRMDALKWDTTADPLSEDGDPSFSDKVEGPLNDFICTTCGDESLDHKTYQIHAEICQQVKSGKFRSPLSIQELVNLRLKIDANRIPAPGTAQPSQSRPMSTQVISKRTSFQGKKLFPCYKCGKEFERAGSLVAHELRHREEAGTRKDREAEKAADTFSNTTTFTKPTPFHCPFCIRKFSDATECEKHIPSHTQTFQCTFCPKNCDNKSDLDRHLLTHTKENPYKCPKCTKGFNDKSSLKLHVQSVHENYRPFQCELCPKAFTQKIALTKHVRMHTGERPFQCQYCPKTFATKQQQIGHERTHTGEKPYACQYCPKKFTLKQQMKIHERIHTGEKPYKCKYCEKGFIEQNAKQIHERTHTGEKPFQCEFCARRFTTKTECRKHTESKTRCPNSTKHKD